MNADLQNLLENYIEDVHHPEVSGFEILDLLSSRSTLAEQEASLSATQRRSLEEADACLISAVPILLTRLNEIAPLPELRQRADASPSHWWWYLDLIQQTALSLASA